MKQFGKKLAEAWIEVLINRVSEQSINWALEKSKKYVSETIEKGRDVHNKRINATKTRAGG